MREYFFETVFTFGKYQNKTFAEVFQDDIDYINWCIKDLHHFYLSDNTIADLKKYYPNITWVISDDIKKSLEEKEIKYAKETEICYSDSFDDFSDNSSMDDLYFDGGGGNEWSDPTQFWGD